MVGEWTRGWKFTEENSFIKFIPSHIYKICSKTWTKDRVSRHEMLVIFNQTCIKEKILFIHIYIYWERERERGGEEEGDEFFMTHHKVDMVINHLKFHI